jgi:hypothetical protein
LGLPFLDFFYNFIRILQVAAKAHQRGKNLLVLRPLELLNIHNYTLDFNSQHPRISKSLTDRTPSAEGRSPPVMWARRKQTNGTGLRLALPSLDWWRRISRGGRWRAAAAGQWRRGRGSSDSGETRGGAQQCAARVASTCPREGARWVSGLGAPAERRAWQCLPGGGRGSLGSGEQAARLGQPEGV